MLSNGGSQSNRTVNGNAITEVTTTDLELAVDYLEGNNGKKLTPNQEGRDAFGTAPVWQAYWMIISTDLRTDFKNLSNFLPTADYPRQQSVLESEFGSCDEVRLVKTTEAYKDTSVSPAIYYNFLFAANGYGRIDIDDQSMDMIIKPLGAGEDALNQRQTQKTPQGLYKLSLIDLDLCDADDKAQAEQFALAA